MLLLFRRMKAWLPLLRLGNTVARRNELEDYSEYLVLKSLNELGLFDYLKKKRSLPNIVEQFGWNYPSKYVDDLLKLLVKDKILIKKADNYLLTEGFDLQKPEVKHIQDFNDVFAEYASAIPDRLEGKFYDYTGRLALFNWDSALAGKVYQAVRDSALNFVNIKKFHNVHLLDVGCGPGYETADLWLRLIGNGNNSNKITALDYDEDLLTIAREEFCLNLAKNGYKEVTWDELQNPPKFVHGSADKMDMFDDNSFDAVYFSNFLHWLPEPLAGVKEMYRVLKPGGLIFGGQGTSEVTNLYLDITARVIKGMQGYFSREQFLDWFKKAGFIKIKTATMVNTFKAIKPNSQ
ncbi:MAG: methyltransferase domain-containing protein [Candidatus Heimdallarchaeota archaeon]|nr:methyltransferase domain-containing protein [Candidatus Heimdallarchaeota archaeon]